MNKSVLDVGFVERAICNLAEDEKCKDLHLGSCHSKSLTQALNGSRSIGSLYLVVHLLPLLINLRKTLNNPKQSLKRFLKGYLKSMIFVSGSLYLIRRSICFFTQHYRFSHLNTVFAGWIAGPVILFELPSRQVEMSLYVLGQSIETLYNLARRRNGKLWIRCAENYLNGISLAAICYFFLDQASLFRAPYKSILNMCLRDL